MPDISKCSGLKCPLKETCYRFTSEASDWQSYLSEAPYDTTKNSCDYHMAIWDKKSEKIHAHKKEDKDE